MLEAQLGRTSLAGLQNTRLTEELGFPRLLSDEQAAQLAAQQIGGRLGLGKEEVVWAGNVWMPVAIVELNLMKMKLVGRATHASNVWTAHDLFAGTFVTRLDELPQLGPVPVDGPKIDPRHKMAEPARRLDQIIAKYDRARTDETRNKYRNQLTRHGVPERHTVTTANTSIALYPMHLVLLRRKDSERVVALDAFRVRVDDDLSLEMSKNLSHIRSSIGL